MTRQTIGDDPLDGLFSLDKKEIEKKTKNSTRKEKQRLTVHIPLDIIERIKNAVYWTPGLTLAGLAEEALEKTVSSLEKKRGGPFPSREKELKGGRPLS